MVGVLSASGWQYVTGERIMVEFTSFKKSIELPDRVKRYSVAVYQPKGFNYPKLDFFDIRKNGWWIRPRLYAEDPNPLVSLRKGCPEADQGTWEFCVPHRCHRGDHQDTGPGDSHHLGL